MEHGPRFGRLLTSGATDQTADHAVTTRAQGAASAVAPGGWVEADPPQEVTHGREQTPEQD